MFTPVTCEWFALGLLVSGRSERWPRGAGHELAELPSERLGAAGQVCERVRLHAKKARRASGMGHLNYRFQDGRSWWLLGDPGKRRSLGDIHHCRIEDVANSNNYALIRMSLTVAKMRVRLFRPW
jgi:hypothetical protein